MGFEKYREALEWAPDSKGQHRMHKLHFLLMASLFLPLIGCGPGFGSEFRLPDETMTEDEGVVQDQPDAKVSPTGFDFPDTLDSRTKSKILSKYGHLDPKHQVPDKLLEKAILFFDRNYNRLGNHQYLAVIDFSKRSTESRFFIVNVQTGGVTAIHVAHGKGTDPEHDGWANPKLFSNTSGSLKSSLGFYLTESTYHGGHGLSLRLIGLSTTNSKAYSRAIVLHGATYVKEASVIQGRSYGCPAVSMSLRDKVVGILKGGAVIYAGL
jgi:hypothetical protein